MKQNRAFFRATPMLISALAFSAAGVAQTPAQDPNARPQVVIETNEPKYVAPNTLDRIGRIWAPVKINGKGPFRLVLDTSANSSAIVPSVADRLALQTQQTSKVKLIGVTGSAIVETVNVDSMEVGDISLGGARLPIVADVFGGAEGVLGPKSFSDKRIFVDFHKDLIRISKSAGRSEQEGFSRIPITTDRLQLPTFEMRVGGVKTKAILSTGGQRTIGNDSLREALLKRAREGKEEDIVGVTLEVVQGQSIAVPPISIGNVSFRNVRITFADPYVFEQWKLTREPAVMIGMDIIGSLDSLIIDYKTHEFFIRTRR